MFSYAALREQAGPKKSGAEGNGHNRHGLGTPPDARADLLHQGLPLFFPADPAIPAKAIPAKARFDRSFVRDKELLQREQKPDVPAALTTIAYLTVLLVAVVLIAALTAGLARLARTGTPDGGGRFVRGEPPAGTRPEAGAVAR